MLGVPARALPRRSRRTITTVHTAGGDLDAGTVYLVLDTEQPPVGNCGTGGCTVADLETGAQLSVPQGSLTQSVELAVKGVLVHSQLPAPPPAAESPCSALAFPDFALDSPDAEVEFFEGRLVLGIDASDPDLVMRLGDDTRHSLADLPLHVATQCEELPYIVSVCVAERDPFEVRGVISPADAWHKPCRGLLQRRGEARP